MTPVDLVLPGSMAAGFGVLMLRMAWGRPRRSFAMNGAGWALLLAGSILGAISSGAWGIAMVTVIAMVTAIVLLSVAAATAPAGKPERVPSRRTAAQTKLPPRQIGRRIVTLLLTGPAPMIVALLVALALRALADMAGWSQANSNVLCLLMMPILWAGMTFWLLMMRSRRRQVMLLAGAAILSAAILWIGSMA